jgi:hypothetical protein
MNPFTERGRITDPQRFIGRWRELSVVFDRIVAGRPVFVTGPPGIGKSSLLTHVAQSAAVNLERPELTAFYVNMAVFEEAAPCYRLIIRALQHPGDNAAALEVALLQREDPLLLCLDNADQAIAAGWGAEILERLARIARHAMIPSQSAALPAGYGAAAPRGPVGMEPGLLLVAAGGGGAPPLSEPYAVVGMGAIADAELRLLADAYLERTGVRFSAAELREIATLSVRHPAYIQRAAFHLFRSHTQPDYDWRAAYLAEASERPVPGAPLPPAVFEGDEVGSVLAFYGDYAGAAGRPALERPELSGLGDLLALVVPFVAALLAWELSRNWLLSLGVLLASIVVAFLIGRLWPRPTASAETAEPPDNAETPEA